VNEPQADEASPDETGENGSDGYTPPQPSVLQALRFTGYVDVGFAAAQGNGSSFPENDFRVPADYGVDAFARAERSPRPTRAAASRTASCRARSASAAGRRSSSAPRASTPASHRRRCR
jgi:hypothetical protein